VVGHFLFLTYDIKHIFKIIHSWFHKNQIPCTITYLKKTILQFMVCIIYITRVKEYYGNIKTYQKYGVPSQELKLLFYVELQKEENWDFKFLLQIILLSCIRFICVLILIQLRSCANGNMSNKSNLLILLKRPIGLQEFCSAL